MATVKNTRKIGVDHPAPILDGEIGSAAERADTGIVYQDVQTAERIVDEAEEAGNLAAVRYIGSRSNNFAAGLLRQLTRDLVDIALLACADRDRCSGIGQRARDCEPDAARRASDYRVTMLQKASAHLYRIASLPPTCANRSVQIQFYERRFLQQWRFAPTVART